MFGIGTREIVIIAVVLVVLFGAKKIPELAKGIVEAVRHLRGAFKEEAPNSVVEKSNQTKK